VDGIDVFNIYKINCEILYTLDVLVQCQKLNVINSSYRVHELSLFIFLKY
jgi:hypothetical protein